jgi:hypothetical protein
MFLGKFTFCYIFWFFSAYLLIQESRNSCGRILLFQVGLAKKKKTHILQAEECERNSQYLFLFTYYKDCSQLSISNL